MAYWKLTIEYEGTRYSGWQEQPDRRTIAGELRRAAQQHFGKRVEMSGAGRTDAGVHALAQVARLGVEARAEANDLMRAINDRLPADINILKVEPCARNFDPRRDAIARYYLYQISTRRTALAKKYVWWVKDRLNVRAMGEAARRIEGRHNFESFSERAGDEKSPVVVVEHASVEPDGDLILFHIGASHFLWKMVRRLVGALVEVGRGRLSAEEFHAVLDRKLSFPVAAHTAPPSGLFLERVVYKNERSDAQSREWKNKRPNRKRGALHHPPVGKP
jgi:tRNA pseudouridine38-40 synthase